MVYRIGHVEAAAPGSSAVAEVQGAEAAWNA
jgi:hypothetical protein